MTPIEAAVKAIAGADALLITAGAGMGVDSGLPDFRGNEGFWQAYPPIAKLGLSFSEMAQSRWFSDDPAFAWGFYGHRLRLYREAVPHLGFALLLGAARNMPGGYFVVTSNVDGQFQKAGFDPLRINEIHGSIHHLQCTKLCRKKLWSADHVQVNIDLETFRAKSPLPICPECGETARPNILMFSDPAWVSHRANDQEGVFGNWLDSLTGKRLVIIECGAGTAIPSIRSISSQIIRRFDATLIRINPREITVPDGHIAIEAGALDGLSAIL